ncbi:DEAD/DEAH box helicase [Acidaminobacter sp. JC074]|uniref:DEAD/DEAH box helicase n=1 Tax=Acidaminobacter sp. JC074 TaxID=2530199 RepID=UPI001F0DC88A|nr:DEAD/DEAH box helicase [Acidaminobacter sp. JC074]MCH4888252.1 DEAD/DEAH box helicase [Acidaminobacter sp. JC074]
MKFKEYPLDNNIKRALSELGFKEPLEVQKKVLPLIEEGKDVVVKSQTGSGKTAAFAIPLCNHIEIEDKHPQAVVIAPTRELALQINEDIINIGRYRGIKTLVAFGKTLIKDQRDALKKYPHIVVATPGRLRDLVDRKFLRTDDLKYLVLDEADELLNLGFEEQLHDILSKMPRERNTLLFSATMQSKIEHIIMDDMIEPVRIEIEAEVDIHKKIEQIYYEVEEHKKLDFLRKMLDYEKPVRCIIFANTQNKVESIYKIMSKWNNETGMLHGGMEQDLRMKMISKFKRGELKYLIATDLASRGLHVRNLSHVINFNLPFEFENYVHRIGRTGRVNETGIAINLCSYKESENIISLQEYLGYEIVRKGPKKRVKPKKEETRRTKFKADKAVKFSKVKIFAGRRAHLKAGDFMHTITRLPGVTGKDLGKIQVQDHFTIVEINAAIIDSVATSMRKMKLKGKSYRVQRLSSGGRR